MKIPDTIFLKTARKNCNKSKKKFENFKKLFGKLLEKFYSNSGVIIEKF